MQNPKPLRGKIITADEITNGLCVETIHLNRGDDGFGYGYRMVDHPRVEFLNLYNKGKAYEAAGERVTRVWTLDGIRMESLEAVIAGHAEPPKLTERERQVLDLIADEPAELRATQRRITEALGDEAPQPPYAPPCSRDISALRNKGLVEITVTTGAPNEIDKAMGRSVGRGPSMIRRRRQDG